MKDAHGQTAEDIAKQMGAMFNGWEGKGWLAMP